MKNLKLLSPEILNYYKFSSVPNIAIIGNGGATPQDDEELDQADVVVRFNNFASRQGIKNTKDPNRCDILFTHFDLHSHTCNPSDVVIAIPYPFKIKQVIERSKKWYPNARLWMVNPYLNYQLCRELDLNSEGFKHPLPSLGMTGLYHMLEWPARFYIGGFNWYFNDGKIQNQPITMKSFPSNFNHFYVKEIHWAIQNAYGKLNIKFSDSCKQILNQVKTILDHEP